MQSFLNVLFYAGWTVTAIGCVGMMILCFGLLITETHSNAGIERRYQDAKSVSIVGSIVVFTGLVITYAPPLIYNLLN